MTERQIVSSRAKIGDQWLTVGLLTVAGLGWWWSAATARQMRSGMGMHDMNAVMSFAGFLVAWVAMMAAMMLPAIVPVVRLYARGAARGTVAPVPAFLAGYAAVWSAMGVPVFFVWRRLDGGLINGTPRAGRIAGVVLVAAALYQLSPFKALCLSHCRSPMSFFLRQTRNMRRPAGALAVGAHHGLYCLGCCWLLMAVLVAFGTMQLAWMAVLALLILFEKASPVGERIARLAGVAFLGLGLVLLVHPVTIGSLI